MDLETSYAKLYMDRALHHSSGYFRDGATTLRAAQLTKVDAVLKQLELKPGMRLLDVGCGWGATARAATTKYDVEAIGITLSQNQAAYAQKQARRLPGGTPPIDFRCQRWEDFNESVDRIVCVNAFENFDDKSQFLSRCKHWLRPGGRMVMLTVTADRPIFRVASTAAVVGWAEEAGFAVEMSRSLALDYARTLECYIFNLNVRKSDAVSLIGSDRFLGAVNFYSHCATFLRTGLNELFEFTFTLDDTH